MNAILLSILAYFFNPSDWQQYPKLYEIRNFTADDVFGSVYAVTRTSILTLDASTNLPGETFGAERGLPQNISMAIYDRSIIGFWVVTTEGRLYTFQPQSGITSSIILSKVSPVSKIGLSNEYLFLDHGSFVQPVEKLSGQEKNVEPDSTTHWFGPNTPESKPRSYPYLNPWFFTDDALMQRSYTMVFKFRNRAYVSVPGYGYLVFDALSWRELLRYQSPGAVDVSSFFSSDTSLYAFGTNGVDQLVQRNGSTVFRAFSRWGTTTSPQPAWSDGIAGNLRLTTYDKARLIEGNLFLLAPLKIDVYNLGARTLSTITTQKTIYDVDFHKDSLFVASEDGITLAIIPKGSPAPLEDERMKLVRNDVLAIVRGKNARYFWTGSLVVKQSRSGWSYYVTPGFMPVPQRSVTGTDSLIIIGGKGGVTIYNPETNYQLSLTSKDGLLSDNVTAVALQDRYLWIATDAGFSRFDLSTVTR